MELTHSGVPFHAETVPPLVSGIANARDHRRHRGPPVSIRAVRSTPGRALLEIADRADDLLVVGAGCRGRVRRALCPSVARYCLARAACAVLAVPPSPLAGDLTSLHRRVGFRLPLDALELTDGTS